MIRLVYCVRLSACVFVGVLMIDLPKSKEKSFKKPVEMKERSPRVHWPVRELNILLVFFSPKPPSLYREEFFQLQSRKTTHHQNIKKWTGETRGKHGSSKQCNTFHHQKNKIVKK